VTTHHFILATAGHVDHGKSSLVKALTGTDPDRLPEEKARGITIDLGFAHLDLTVASPAPATFRLGIVDVPGHEDFVKNMVAGVGSIDLALFIVAADDGWMPQTEEHLQILAYLGVARAVVALTKIDLAEGREAEVIAALRGRLSGTPFADAPIVPTSIVSGRGFEDLKRTLSDVLAAMSPPRDLGKPRLPVDRVFTLLGIGTVVTGTLSGGPLRRGQAVVIQPRGTPSRIRSLQSHNQAVEIGGPGTRTALNLPETGRRSESEPEGVARGDVITLPELGAASDTVDVVLERSPRLVDAKAATARPLKDGTRLRVHHGSANVPARVLLRDTPALLPGQRALAQLRCEAPVFMLGGDHLILRDWAEQTTLAGGLALDPDGNRRLWRDPRQRRLLETRSGQPANPVVWVHSLLERDGIVHRAGILVKSRFTQAEIAEAVRRLLSERQALEAGEFLAGAAWWGELRRLAAEAIDREHAAHPERLGLGLTVLRAELGRQLRHAGVFEALLTDLCRADFRQTGNALQRAGHRASLPPQLQAAGTRVRAALAAKPLEPPSRKELAPDGPTQQAVRFLIETGEAIEVGPELVLAREAYDRALESIRAHLRARGSATVSDLRQLLGSSRRIMVPLLEKLDRDGVTRREGDVRVLKSKGVSPTD
jgi:selenocysteine-specific elongation factor